MSVYVEARRELGITGELEKQVLLWLCARVPARIGPDHLTLLGAAALVAGGVAYALTPRDLRWLHAVNLSLLLNWLGDSLDGTLARFRRTPRPRYGFYVDHFVDAVGATTLLGGLALSGLAHPAVAAALLVAYLLMSVEIALCAHVTGTFRITRGPIGGTELRLLLIAANLAASVWPRLSVLGHTAGLFDVIAGPAAVAIAGLALASAAVTARTLDAEDRARLAQRG